MRKAPEKDGFLRRWWLALVLAAGLFALLYAVVTVFRTGDSDYIDHLIGSMGMDAAACLRCFYNGSEKLWHVCVRAVMIFTKNGWTAAALVTAAADTAAHVLLFAFFDSCLPRKASRPVLAAVTACVFIAGALYVPILSPSVYLGKGAVNTWHNPTNIMVRPFAVAVFWMTLRIYNRYRFGADGAVVCGETPRADFDLAGRGFFRLFADRVYKPAELVLYPLCVLLSAYAKPSFLQFFGPAVLTFLLIDVFRTRGKLLPFCVKLALAYVPAAVIVLMQFGRFFGGVSAGAAAAQSASSSSAGVAVYFMQASFAGPGEFFQSLGGVLADLLMLCAFPLAVLALDAKRFWRAGSGRLSLLCLGWGELEALCLHETGSRAAHGNFLWGFYLSVWAFWCAAAERFTALLRQGGRTRRLALWLGCPLLAWHAVGGVWYLAKILQSGLYLY